MPDLIVPLTLNIRGAVVQDLHASLGKLGYFIPEQELDEQEFGVGTRDAVLQLQIKYQLPRTGIFDEATRAVLANALTEAETNQYRVEGRIFLDYGLPAGGVVLLLYSRGFGGADTQLGESKTDEQGYYAFTYDPKGKAANLDVRAVDAQGKDIPLSATKYNADKREVLNLVAPASLQPLMAEYQRLAEDLEKQLGGLDKLADARENEERQDLTLLHQATGWDARLIALAATANKLSADTGISQDVLYALFRVGLPCDKQQLARVSSLAVEKALSKAKEAGILGLDDQQIAGAKTAFENFALTARRAGKAPGALSSFADLLSKSGLTDVERGIFEDLYFTHDDEAAELWQKARERGIPDAKIDGLRLQGKLAYLTLNNADLTASLQGEIGTLDNLAQLVDKDLYQENTWKARLNGMAGNDEQALQQMIPPAYVGEKTSDRLEAYAADLARKVRRSFPTRVAGRMIEKDELRLGDDHGQVKDPVRIWLTNAEGLGFELGKTPMNAFIKQYEDELSQNIALDTIQAVTQRVKTLQRLYQIAPSSGSLNTMFGQGLTSAYDVVMFPPDVFLDRFGGWFPSRQEASLVYRNAQQVSAITYTLFTTARQVDSTPVVYAISPPPARREAAKVNLIKHYPTMQSLFGSLDFCECEECRSVLSPAAYFVDLLQFLDPKPQVWQSFLDDWKRKHNGEPYQSDWTDDDGQPQPEEKRTPYYALTQRRPDLPQLQLTCENTNTALPYIDIVNEILEYSIANEKLTAEAVHDTGDATTPELLAEPQNILPEAYDQGLKQARFPLVLPFDLWLETVRCFLDYFETPFWQVMETFRPEDELFAPSSDEKPYNRSAIFAEYLGISPDEYAIFTDADPQANWFRLYGYATEEEALTEDVDKDGQRTDLLSAKNLSRRLGVSYVQLTDLLLTGFVNPQLQALAPLRKLDVEVSTVFRYQKHPGYEALSADEVAWFEQRLDELTREFNPARDPAGFNAQNWLDTTWRKGDFHHILVLADPDAGCNFDQTTLRYADGSAATPLDFLKMNLFVRLWKKLGWTVEETDRALQVFLPATNLGKIDDESDSDANRFGALGPAFETALLYLAHLKALDGRVEAGPNSRLKLLTLWSNLPTGGKNSLYAQLFLTPSVLKSDPAFDDPLGHYLSAADVFLKDHLLAVQAALNLTPDEVRQILADPKKDFDTVELSLATVSQLYRYGLLAKALKLSVRDLLTLKGLSGLDPFTPLEPAPVTSLDEDYPFEQTLRFVEMAEKVRESAFTVEDLDYLLCQRFDPVGKYRLNSVALLALVKSLATDLSRIRTEHTVPDCVTEDFLRQEFSLVLSPELLEGFLGALTGAGEYEAIQGDVQPAAKLDPREFAGERDIHVSYDEVLSMQRLTCRGLLLDAKKAQLEAANPSPLLTNLLDRVQTLAFASFARLVETVLESLMGTVEYDATQENVQPPDKLDAKALASEPTIRVSYDQKSKTQKLVYRGLLLDTKKAQLEAANPSPLLTNLLDRVQTLARAQAEALIKPALVMLMNTVEFEETEKNVQLVDRLNPEAVGREPAIQVTYDEVGQTQHLVFRGLLSDTKKAQLEAANPSKVLANLLDGVQSQANTLIQQLRVGFLDASDFDSLFAHLDELANAAEEEDVILAKAFLPFISQRLASQLIVQTLATSLSADPALVESLLTSTELLTDPSQAGRPLLDAFAAAADRGLTTVFFASVDGSGAPLDSSAGANSERFAGYLEVPTTGAYRFFIQLGKQDAEAELRFAHLPDPLIRGKAASNEAEISQFLELKAGVPYQFTLAALNLSGGPVTLLVQSENLPKGPIDRLTLYPQAVVERIQRAWVLLSKTLQLTQGLTLNEREIRYLLSHPDDFGDIDLSKLPTRAADNSADGAVALFGQFQRLVDYADLKRDVAGGADDLISVFENARHTYSGPVDDEKKARTAHFELLANLTRRETAVVEKVVDHLVAVNVTRDGNSLRIETPDLANEKGIQRIWEALQIVERLGIPTDEIVHTTRIGTHSKAPEVALGPKGRFAIARDLKDAVKAHYEAETWQRIAQPIFDKLRQRQRDALVAYLIHRERFERMEQLFEYFLIDPGMEPVVQTSRLRLAISSVQLFIQRCLLNLEPQVHPSAINSQHWQWMKRYRVWEANRKIFLFPENWLEPEFRDDKTHLFQELEGALLQGDVSNDLAEDAFFNYLKKLEELARLEIVTMCCEENSLDPAANTLHVIGRTYGLPHKYFYRRYANHMWTPWEPVTAEIEGDHIVAIMWQERLHLFWITFLEKGAPNAQPASVPTNSNTKEEKTLSNITMSEAVGSVKAVIATKTVEVQLHWSEYFQGQWTTRQSSGFDNPMRTLVDSSFLSSKVYIQGSKEYVHGEEGALLIHLSNNLGNASIKQAFRVVSKNSLPEPVDDSMNPLKWIPYGTSDWQATWSTGSNLLYVNFLKFMPGGFQPHGLPILEEIGDYSLLLSNNPRSADNESSKSLVEALFDPFFYQDKQYTFFVEQTSSESSIAQQDGWGIPDLSTGLRWEEFLGDVPIDPEGPIAAQPLQIDPGARFKMQTELDWVTNAITVLQFDGHLIGQGGGLDLSVSLARISRDDHGSAFIPGAALSFGGRLNVIGSGGLNSALLENLNVLRSLNSVRSLPSSGFADSSIRR